MKKKIIVLMMLLFVVLPYATSSAYTIRYYLMFIKSMDQYRMDYSWPTGSASLKVHFVSDSGKVYDLTFNEPPTGRLYLTCNGNYSIMFFDSAGTQIGSFVDVHTSMIVNPTCQSYDGQTGQDDLGATQKDNGDGTYDLTWKRQPGGTHTKVYKDGEEVADIPGTTYKGPSGSYTLVDLDDDGNVKGVSDLNVPDFDRTGGTPGDGDDGQPPPDDSGGESGSCDGCKLLTDMLACPGWDEYMGDLTGAIKNALPPPPDWDAVADKIGKATVDHLSDYIGPVPDAPSQAEIDNATPAQKPVLNTDPGEANQLTPQVPSDFNDKKPFNIDDGPQIEVKDESKPFLIQDPLDNVPHDEPGVPVLPGDPRNSSNGIKAPEDPIPNYEGVPVPVPGNADGGADPGQTEPTPSVQPGEPPIPSSQPEPNIPTSPTPIPGVTGGEIPIPKKID